MPAGRHVAHAKVAHDVDSRALGDHGRLAQLPRGMEWLVPDRLAMRSDGPHLLACDAGVGDDTDYRLGEPAAEIEREPAVLLRRAAAQRLSQPSVLLVVVGCHAKRQQRGALVSLRAGRA